MTTVPDATEQTRVLRPNRRLQQLGGAAAVAAGGLTALASLPTDGPAWLSTGAAVLGGVLLVVAAVMLVQAFVGDRAPLSWAKVGGILLLFYSVMWLVPLVMTPLLSPEGGFGVVTTGSDAARIVLGLAAAAAIAARWPVRGFNRWSPLLVVAGDIVLQLAYYGAAAGSLELTTAMVLAWPLAVIALGAGHALAARRMQRAVD